MDFGLSDEQRQLRDSVIAFARTIAAEDGWQQCAEHGIQGLPIPVEYGGAGRDVVDSMIAMQALGYGCDDSGLVFSLCSHIFTCAIPIALFGTGEQKRRYLPAMARGDLAGGHAMTEPGAGSDACAIATTATAIDGGWRLSGSKSFVSNAPIADVLLVFATTDPARGWAGITAFLVDRDSPGVEVGAPLDTVGLETAPIAEVRLAGVEVAATAMLGRVGQGLAIFSSEMEWERCCLFAGHLGQMQRQLERCVEFARKRSQFGKPIAEHQAIAHKLADMRVRVELGELILHKVAWLKSQGKRARIESSIAKLFVSESFVASSLDAIQIHGGHGFLSDSGIDRDLRDAVGSKLYSGTSEIQRNLIASLLES